MADEESQRHLQAMEQAKQLLLMDAITTDEYAELMRCHQAYIDQSGGGASRAAQGAASSASASSSSLSLSAKMKNDAARRGEDGRRREEEGGGGAGTGGGGGGGGGGARKKGEGEGEGEGEEVRGKKIPSSPSKKLKKKRDPKKKNIAEKNWLSHYLASHFSSFDDLHDKTKSTWVEAMEKTNIEAGTRVMEQGDKDGR